LGYVNPYYGFQDNVLMMCGNVNRVPSNFWETFGNYGDLIYGNIPYYY
jgi:hypothetical protein